MADSITIKIGYGVLNPTINEQLIEQGYELSDADRFERYRTSIYALSFANILTDAQTQRALGRLHKQVMANIRPVNFDTINAL